MIGSEPLAISQTYTIIYSASFRNLLLLLLLLHLFILLLFFPLVSSFAPTFLDTCTQQHYLWLLKKQKLHLIGRCRVFIKHKTLKKKLNWCVPKWCFWKCSQLIVPLLLSLFPLAFSVLQTPTYSLLLHHELIPDRPIEKCFWKWKLKVPQQQ